MKKKICIISGPTASGKTATSIKLAQSFGGEIINFDSLLFYKELSIGTAKPTLEEMAGIPHHMINIRSAKNPMNAASYRSEALPLLEKILDQNNVAYLVGGSGFYLQALIYGMYDSETTPSEIIQKSNDLFEKEGILPFRMILKEKDPESFRNLHENDHYRIRRAVEHYWTTGSPFSLAQAEMKIKRQTPLYEKKGWKLHHVYLDLPKSEHFALIQERTQLMFEKGLIQEVENLLKLGFTGEEKPLQSIGYKETLRFLKDNDYTLEVAQNDINIATRQLAKAQRTWFKKWEKNIYHPIEDKDKIIEDFKSFLME